MEKSLVSYFILDWAVVGMIDEGSCMALSELKKKDDVTMEEAVERYVIGYMSFWRIAFIKKERMNRCSDPVMAEKGRKRIEQYIEAHPPVSPLPKFYIIFLNQPEVGCDADGLSDVFCV
ncbi:hypothetical protein [uncultured Bacteroides sp.]|uniref:hypothetical protein n=1 Tax=uncultured Bacteroides sp. TaxID=162156 RepID=UPI002607B30E|nr:hypothetical protein [uncultured Bacteroides sp.]